MATPSGVDAAYLRTRTLAGLLGGTSPLLVVDDTILSDAVTQAEAEVANNLSTRWVVTTFNGYMDPAAPPAPTSNSETEDIYDLPSRWPGDGFIRLYTRIRPIQSLTGVSILFPSGIPTIFLLALPWFRVDHSMSPEILFAPALAGVGMSFGGLPLVVVGYLGSRLPKSLKLSYTAGLTDADKLKFPQLKQLVALRAALILMPDTALRINPLGVTSTSADGLSQSQGAFALKDYAEYLQKEYDRVLAGLIRLWDGAELMVF